MRPICLVTGFLGTGKTTLLRHIVARSRDRAIVYLINEFSAHDVDGAMVAAENPQVVSIPGGSIFCKCLVSEFISKLKLVAEQWPDAEGLVIEASGMTNPKVLESMLVETGLDQSYRLATIICVLDPHSFLKLRHTLPNIIAQIEAADVVLINKCDLNPPEQTAAAAALVREINPAAEQIHTVRSEVELDLFGEHAARGLTGAYAKCRDPDYATFVTERPYDGTMLARFVVAHADSIYRVKGTLEGESFDYSSSGVIRQPQADARPKLAWIVKGRMEARILAKLESLG